MPETDAEAAVGATGEIVKLTSLMSKKMLPTASTLIRAVLVGLFGTVIVSVPSFGVLALMTIGNGQIKFFDLSSRQTKEIALANKLPLLYYSNLSVSADRNRILYSRQDQIASSIMLAELN